MKNTKKLFLTVNLIIAAAVFVGNYFYLTEGGLLLKGLCSGGFALMGVINLCYAYLARLESKSFHIAMSVGLILAMLGDIVLGFDFVIGAGLFAAGHICYFVAYCLLKRIRSVDVIISAVLFAGAGTFVLFCPLLTFSEPIMKWVCFVYALIISIMVGKALGNLIREPSALTAILAVGCVLFFVSDLMLVFDWFMGLGSWTGKLCMATYYPAQCSLAFGTYYLTASKDNH